MSEALAAKVDPAAFLAIGRVTDYRTQRLVWFDTRDGVELGWIGLEMADNLDARHMAYRDALRSQSLRYPFAVESPAKNA